MRNTFFDCTDTPDLALRRHSSEPAQVLREPDYEPRMMSTYLAADGVPEALVQKTFPGRVRVKFAQNEGHEKATKKPRKSREKRPNTVFLSR